MEEQGGLFMSRSHLSFLKVPWEGCGNIGGLVSPLASESTASVLTSPIQFHSGKGNSFKMKSFCAKGGWGGDHVNCTGQTGVQTPKMKYFHLG